MGSFSAEEYFYKVDNMVLSSCKLLRKLFQTRWKEKTDKDWEHTEEQGKLLLESEDGKKVAKYSNSLQNKIIKKGCLDEWDMSILSMVLQNFGDQNSYKLENDAVRQFTKLRNKLAHHSTKKLTREEYNTNVELFKENLLVLGVASSEIEKIIDKAGITSSEVALEATKKLLKQGEKYLEDGEFLKAVACFDEATTMPSLLPEHEGAVYEKRAEFYLKQAKYLKRQNLMRSDSDNCVEQAMLDLTLALQLNDSSWNAHFLIAQCYRWQACYEKAIQYYNRALALSPVQKRVKSELDLCKVSAAQWDNNLYPYHAPITLSEAVEEQAVLTGKKLSVEEFVLQETKYKEMKIKGHADAFRGHQYQHGWQVPQNLEKAAHHFALSAEVGNDEGIYALGICYANGLGVTQDLKKAYNLYLQAANMPPNHPWVCSGTLIGVSAAQSKLGRWFHQGIYVKQDYYEAVNWYLKAAENGCEVAANNLGCMYFNGQGVKKKLKKAEMYWKQAVICQEPSSAVSLMYYYLHQLEPEKARVMFETGKELGDPDVNMMTEDEFNKLVESRLAMALVLGEEDRKRVEKDVVAFERKHKLETKGMTFYERLQRQRFETDSNLEKVLKYIEEVGNNYGAGGNFRCPTLSEFKIIQKRANEGSITARNVFTSINAGMKLARFVMQNTCQSAHEKNIILELLYNCCIGEYQAACRYLYEDPVEPRLKPIIAELFEDNKCEKGEVDMKIRLCYVFYMHAMATTTKDTFMLEILKRGVKMYPDNVRFYDMISNCYGFCEDPKSGLEWVDKGLEKFPVHVDLLFSRAIFLCQLTKHKHLKDDSTSKSKLIDAFDDFLRTAPPDHHNVPEIFYCLAFVHMCALRDEDRDSGLRMVAHYFSKGQEAEKTMLPCYLPYSQSAVKRGIQKFLELEKAKLNHSSQLESEAELSVSNIAPTKIWERKPYLISPVKKQVVLRHRRNVKQFENSPILPTWGATELPNLQQAAPRKLSHLKSITLSEMNPSSERIFEDRIIDLTIIEDPCFDMPSICLVVEDEYGDVTHLYIFNVEQNEKAELNLTHGSTIAIMNPYMTIGRIDGTSLRNDEPRCIIYLDKVNKMCRFCGEENAEQLCARCMKACYCSKECQELDWKLFKHKLICHNI